MKTVTFLPQVIAEKVAHRYDLTISLLPPKHWFSNIDCERIFVWCDDTEIPCSGLKMFDVMDAIKIIDGVDMDRHHDILVHCQAGMSRSAAVARWISDNHDYELIIHPEGVGTDMHYNRHIYRTLDAAHGQDMETYYEELERIDRMMGVE